MERRKRGLYEVLVTEALDEQPRELSAGLVGRKGDVRPAEVADRVALHLARVVERAVAAVDERERVGGRRRTFSKSRLCIVRPSSSNTR
ncbi:MAG: helicase [Myxococcaceae bacterium]|nr:helicase [Myxococcaceae bacterium]